MRFLRKSATSYGYLLFSFMSFCLLGIVYYYVSPQPSKFVSVVLQRPEPKPDYRAVKTDIQAATAGVMVFLHIQKTGGTEFGRHLLFLDVGEPCVLPTTKDHKLKKMPKGSKCYRPGQSKRHKGKEMWLFSRFTRGWPCGVHADWTELHECVEKTLEDREGRKRRQFFYVTMLREPVARFVSEFAHVKRGATWASPHNCNKHKVPKRHLRDCYPGYSDGQPWPHVTLEKFLNCKSNLGINRQTRMLADLTLVNCYNTETMTAEDRDKKILNSAMVNLRSLPYVGLTEYQIESKDLFEHTFDLQFTDSFDARHENISKSEDQMEVLTESDRQWIREVNHLDLKLYDYAKKIFLERVDAMRKNSSVLRDYWQSYLLVDNNDT